MSVTDYPSKPGDRWSFANTTSGALQVTVTAGDGTIVAAKLHPGAEIELVTGEAGAIGVKIENVDTPARPALVRSDA